MSISTLQEYTRIAKYAKYLPEEKRRETWAEQVTRVFDMHRKKFEAFPEISEYIDEAEAAVKKKEVLGSQRVLQFGGDPIFKHNARLYNCGFGHINRPRVFQELMYLLLCGCGIGFSVQKHHVEALPPIHRPPDGEKIFVVPDTIEGWADSIGVLISSYLGGISDFDEYVGFDVVFDYSLIRPAGSPLSSGSKAPGPKGLERSLGLIQEVLENALGNLDRVKLQPIQVYDIIMHAADAVISGGVRRSATIALFSPDDEDMAKAKTGRWLLENPQRGRSNNSALLVRDRTTKQDFDNLMECVREFGEPGFIWAEDTECGFNPCAEISLYPVDEETGKTGWQFCNLTEINGKKANTEEAFYSACRIAAIIGTLQAAYIDFPYVGSVTESITRREALLGVSVTGMMDSPDILFDPAIQRQGAKIVKEVNRFISGLIGTNVAARTTCIKPAGSTSCILGTASGIHPHHAKRYFRRVQANVQENPVSYFKNINPRAVEQSVWDPNGVTEVITFLCEVPSGAKTKNQIDALTLLESVKTTQQNWVRYGTNIDLCVRRGMRHNVSNTIHVKEHEWDSVADFIYKNRKDFAGVSLLPYSGDRDYPQAPFCAVPYPNDILREYGAGSFFASGIIEAALVKFDGDLWSACDCLLGIGESLNHVDINKRDWASAAIKFADSHFEGNVRKMTYCLKDVHNLKLWEKLSQEYKDVDWTLMSEETDNIDFQQESACSGGACELPTEYLEALRNQPQPLGE
jgi:ribonucleoside-triphosphate reductase|tara:strand:+ start:3107 stop:5344 length:2238 start_codon:yes stop_codon:yes gene_type:complete